jgi:hypothetical protein
MVENDLNLNLNSKENEIIVNIPSHSTKTISVQLRKLNLESINEDLNKHLNDKLLFKLSYLNSSSFILLGFNFKEVRLYEKYLFKSPFEIALKNYQVNEPLRKTLVILKSNITLQTSSDRYIKIQFANKIHFCIIKNDFNKAFEVLTCIHELLNLKFNFFRTSKRTKSKLKKFIFFSKIVIFKNHLKSTLFFVVLTLKL